MATGFETAKATLGVFQFLGWIIVAIGLVGFFMAYEDVGFLPALGAAALIGSVGIAIVVGVQLALAQIATAENTAAMLAEMRKGAQMQSVRGDAPISSRSEPVLRSVDRQPLVTGGADGGSLERVKGYKGYVINRNTAGQIVVGETVFSGILDAEKHINGMISKGRSET